MNTGGSRQLPGSGLWTVAAEDRPCHGPQSSIAAAVATPQRGVRVLLLRGCKAAFRVDGAFYFTSHLGAVCYQHLSREFGSSTMASASPLLNSRTHSSEMNRCEGASRMES